MAWSDWIGVLTDVANVVEKVFYLISDERTGHGAASEPSGIGGVAFFVADNNGAHVVARNDNVHPVTLAFMGAPGTLLPTLAFTLAANESRTITDQLRQFRQGGVSVGNANGVSTRAILAPETLTKALTFTLQALAVGTVVWLVNGIELGYTRTEGGYKVFLRATSTPPSNLFATLRLRTASGTLSLTGGGPTTSAADGELVSWRVSSDLLDLGNLVQEVDVQLYLPSDAIASTPPPVGREVSVKGGEPARPTTRNA